MRSKVFSFCLLFVLLVAAACSPQVSEIPPTTQPEEATEVPTSAPIEARTLTVLAAASLTESFTEIGAMFEGLNEGVTVSFNFAGSQALAGQLEQGADADVFASASERYMTSAIDAERVNADDSRIFVNNRLVVVYPATNPGEVAELKDLAKPGLKLVLADESVPVGQYALDFLDKATADASFDPQFKDNVLNNVVSYEDNVKGVVTKVSLGEADAGIVYVTDITADAVEQTSTIDIPDALNTIATYPIAPISDSKFPELAQAFVDFVLSEEGQAVLAKYGFVPVITN